MDKKARIISNFIYTIILIPLIYIAVSVVWQSIIRPEEIPDIFGYKIFMILDRNMQNVEYGDLVFTKNINAEELKKRRCCCISRYYEKQSTNDSIYRKNTDKAHRRPPY